MVVVMPNGATSCCSDSIQPSRPNFAAAYAEQNAKPTMPAVDEIETMCPERCLRMTGRTARVTFIAPMRSVPSCRSICSGRSEEHTSELQSRFDLVCRPLLENKKSTDSLHAPHTATATASIAASPVSRSHEQQGNR